MFINFLAIAFGVAWAASIAMLRPRLGLVVAGVVCTFGGLVLSVVSVAFGADAFGVIHFVYVMATLGPVLLSILLFFGVPDKAPRTPGMLALCGLLLVPGILGFWGTHIAPFQLELEEVAAAVPCTRSGEDPLRIGVLSDILFRMVPNNVIEAATSNRNILSVIFFSLCFGTAALQVGGEALATIDRVARSVFEVMMALFIRLPPLQWCKLKPHSYKFYMTATRAAPVHSLLGCNLPVQRKSGS